MALGWIRVACAIGNDPKISGLAFMIGKNEHETIGLLVLVWAAMVEHAKDGDIASVPDTSIERWARWSGKRGKFADAFRQTFAPGGVVKSWDKYNGAAIARAEREAERKRAWRTRQETARAVDADGAQDKAQDGAQDVPRRGKVRDVTRRDETNYNNTTPRGAVDLAQWPKFDALFSPREKAVVLESLNLLTVVARTKLVASIEMWRAGGTAPFVPTPAELAQAFAEYDGDGNPAHFWKFIANVHDRMSAPPTRRRGGPPGKISAGLEHLKNFVADEEVPVGQ